MRGTGLRRGFLVTCEAPSTPPPACLRKVGSPPWFGHQLGWRLESDADGLDAVGEYLARHFPLTHGLSYEQSIVVGVVFIAT